MKAEILAGLDATIQSLILQVEQEGRVVIDVIYDEALNRRGPLGLGMLKLDVCSRPVRIKAPTDPYFPQGAVMHESLHAHRIFVEKVHQIVPAASAENEKSFARTLTDIDNAIEHMIIVPIELNSYPDRFEHWQAVIKRAWDEDLYSGMTDANLMMVACLHWAFLQCMPCEELLVAEIDRARSVMRELEVLEEVEKFCEGFIPLLRDKKKAVEFLFSHFPEHRDDVELERHCCDGPPIREGI